MAKSEMLINDLNATHQASSNKSPREQLLAGLPVTERRLHLGGVTTAVLEGGDGPPVVLLHGPAGYAAKWFRVIPSLARTCRVIAPDLPGHGESDPFDGPVDVDRVVSWLDELIEGTCKTPPTLIGKILGGAIAARFASARGERISRLVLADCLGLRAFEPAPQFGSALMAFVTSPTDDTHDRLWSYCAYDLETLRNAIGPRWAHLRAYNLDRIGVPALADAQRVMMEIFGFPAIPQADLARINVPTTLIWGRHDLATPLSVAQEASRRCVWPLHVVENAADDPAIEQPESFVAVLREAVEAGQSAAS